MFGIIKNYSDLLDESKACRECLEAREVVLRLVDVGIKSADPYTAVARHLKVTSESDVVVAGDVFRPRSIYVVGFGKAACAMAKAVEDVLGDRITAGVVSVPKAVAEKCKLSRVEVVGAGHPLPDEGSIRAAERALEIVSEAGEDDLVIVLVSGGGSALFEKPADDISLSDLVKTTELLLKCGATIHEINTVRKHISLVKGGKLAKAAYPAKVVSLIISDVVGDDLGTIASGPTAPDKTTFSDAYRVLRKYGIWDSVPESVRRYIERGLKGLEPETVKPGDPVFEKVRNVIVASNIEALTEMKSVAEKLGYNAIVLTHMLQGEAREVGRVVASIALSAKRSGVPIKPPAVILLGGETTVTVRGSGKGGRNQELVLSAAQDISGNHGIAIASVGTDGIDGVTDAAGAIADAHTVERAQSIGLDPHEYLMNNDSHTFFKKLGDCIYTGPTGTNVNDIIVIAVTKGQ